MRVYIIIKSRPGEMPFIDGVFDSLNGLRAHLHDPVWWDLTDLVTDYDNERSAEDALSAWEGTGTLELLDSRRLESVAILTSREVRS